MKRFTLLASVLCLAALLHAEGVLKINGTPVEKTLVRIQASENNILVLFDDNTVAMYPMNSAVIDFTEGTGIATLNKTQFFVSKTVVSDQLHVEGLETGNILAIYNASGQLVSKAKAEAASHIFNVSGLAHGVYILRVNNNSIKFIKE